MGKTTGAIAAGLLLLWACPLHAAPNDPFPVRNLSPATALYGLPRVQGSRVEAPLAFAVLLEHVNNFSGDVNDHASLTYDGTSTFSTLALRGALGSRLEWGLELPYVHHDGGFTDGLIDGFHDLFGFPDAGREDVARDRLVYYVAYGGEELVDIDSATGHLGDVRGWLGYRLHDSAGRQGMVRGMLKAPTGTLDTLSGSGGGDASLWLEWIDDRLLQGLGLRLTAMAGATVPGDGDLPDDIQESVVYSAHLGLHYPLATWLTLRGQLDGHSDVLDAGIRQFADAAVQATVGGTIDVGSAAWFDLALSEDLSNASAPDVVFMLRLGVDL